MRRMRRSAKPMARSAAALAVWMACVGCEPEQAREAVSEPLRASRGIITATVSRYISSELEEPYEQFGIVGVFPRFDVDKEDLIDSFLGARAPSSDLALDSCSQPVPRFDSRPRRIPVGETAIELMDVGDLSVEYSSLDMDRAIPTRTFPDLLKVIDGVIYSANESRGVVFEPVETYTILSSGTDSVAPFEVVLNAPEDLGDIRLDGTSVEEQTPTVRRGRDLELAWDGSGGYGDEVIIEVDLNNVGLSWSISCRARDDGSFVIPSEITERLLDPLVSNDHEMTLSRVRQTAFRADGLTGGEFSFVVEARFLVRFETVR